MENLILRWNSDWFCKGRERGNDIFTYVFHNVLKWTNIKTHPQLLSSEEHLQIVAETSALSTHISYNHIQLSLTCSTRISNSPFTFFPWKYLALQKKWETWAWLKVWGSYCMLFCFCSSFFWRIPIRVTACFPNSCLLSALCSPGGTCQARWKPHRKVPSRLVTFTFHFQAENQMFS